MELTIESKVRVQLGSIKEANKLKYDYNYGGWIAWENGSPESQDRVYWYSHNHSRIEIMNDLKGSFTIQ